MDLQCTVAAEGGHCYLDHLPLLGMTLALEHKSRIFHLGSEYKPPTTPFICAGDRARLEMDPDLLKTHKHWDERLVHVRDYVVHSHNIVFSYFAIVFGDGG